MGRRVVDFYCPAAKLAIEVDGNTHDVVSDRQRDRRLLEERGIRILRFSNEEVMRNLDGVLLSIGETVR
ncbi:endonuclease domain-containing protein [Erythrobacter sp.]|uniref:endonuclease domain-containing protein n=1 Tax=Erythrobacter sp. TaxID=1042 RepID=UPI003FA5F47D